MVVALACTRLRATKMSAKTRTPPRKVRYTQQAQHIGHMLHAVLRPDGANLAGAWVGWGHVQVLDLVYNVCPPIVHVVCGGHSMVSTGLQVVEEKTFVKEI